MNHNLTTLLRYTLLLTLCCCASLPLMAQADDDSDDKGDPDSFPPTRVHAMSATVAQSGTEGITIVLADATDEVEVEVCSADGAVVLAAQVTAAPQSRLQVATRGWKRGRYTVRVTSKNGNPLILNTVQVN